MLDLGIQELIVIFAVALLVFGPKKLPELSRTLGKGIRELKSALRGVTDSIDRTEIAIEESVYKEPQAGVPEEEKNKENQKAGAEQDTDAGITDSINETETAKEESVYKEPQAGVPEGEKNKENQKAGAEQDTDAGIKEQKKEKADNG